MASELTFGSVPAFYRDVYEIVCPNQEHVDHDMFLKLLVKSSLPKQTLSQIWELVDNKQGYLSRTGLYKALALTALAQQGKAVNEKLLESFSDQELPKPQLGDLSDLRALSVKVRRERTPNILGYGYAELCELDDIKLEIVPEKKGIILKHVEYELTSRRNKSTVLRRYNDFVAFQEVLLLRFPYRMVPALPPKKLMGADRDFIEQRRRSLRRFMVLVVRHPVLSDDNIVKYFLTFKGSDLQHRIKDCYKGTPDEFMTNENALKSKDIVPLDTQTQFSNSREQIRALLNSVSRIKDAVERIASRASDYASDMLLIGKELSNIGSSTTPVSAWACGNTETWSYMKRGFKQMAGEYAALADKACTQAVREEDKVVEGVNLFLDLLQSYQDLCERHEKGVLTDHQRALQKMGQYKKKKMQATVNTSPESGAVEQLEQRILRQESEISNMENRNYFSLHCVQMETQLIHANLDALHISMENLAAEESKAHAELGELWNHLKPIISNILPKPNINGINSPTKSPTASPIHNLADDLI